MRPRRIMRVGAALATGALVLSACSTPTTDDTGVENDGGAVTAAWNQAFFSYNNQSSTGNATANANIIYMTNSTFNYYDDQAELQQNTDFGSYEKTSDDPLTIKYTVNDNVTWSDGTPVDAADMLLYWVANSAAQNTPDFEPETDADGNILPDEGGENVFFDGSAGSGLENVTEIPEIGDDNKSVTLVYDNAFVDWETTFYSLATPGVAAHVVAKNALDIEDPQEAKDALVTAIQDNDAVSLKKLADFWNTGYNFTSMPDDPDLVLSSGAYTITDFVADEYLTLTRNDDFDWGPKPSIETMTIRFVTDPSAAVSALENGEVDIISPQPTTDVAAAVEALSGVTSEATNDATYEHIDLQFENSKTPGIFEDPNVREAFLKTVPRQEIIDKLITPLNPEAEIRNSFSFAPDFPGYQDVVDANGMEAAGGTDIEGAKTLLEEANIPDPTVCLLYASDNPRRVSEFQLMQASAQKAGFTVTDCGSPDWGTLLGTKGAYDASFFGWQSTSTAVTASQANYVTGGINNFSFYSNPEVDELYKQLEVSTEESEQLDLQKQVETLMVEDGFGSTIFQHPGITAYRDRLSGVSTAPLSPTIFWNYWNWEVS